MTDRNFCDLIDGILKILGVPFKHGVMEFAEGKFPKVYLYYNFYDVSHSHGDGYETATEFVVTFDIISADTDMIDETYEKLLNLMFENGLTRAGGSYSAHSDFPKLYQKSVDFRYVSYDD